ncbi:MAG: EAL domain-containing response regulator [Nevskia sp.]|nr:EAL domain-containing response regulator [Nevskia sp.]
MHLLILDDELGMSTYIGMVARDRGWTVETSGTSGEFQAHFRTRAPDAIVLDLQLGGSSDGVEQLRFLNRQGFTGSIALISGFDARVLASARQVGESLGLAVIATLTKPIRVARIREVLEAIEQSLGQTASSASVPDALENPADSDGQFSPAAVMQAIEGGEMELHLQPILSSATRVVTRLEALLRWRHPKLGLVAPDRFVRIAEEDEAVIDRLTMWVFETAVWQHARLSAMGCPIPISVNISGVNLHGLDFPDRLVQLINASGIPIDGICLEVTESVAMGNSGAMIDILTRLRLKGFQLAMDDFGIGFSSLKALRQMPFSELKIDKSFVGDALGSADSFAIVKSVIELARSIGLETVAEGVETEPTATLLTQLGATGLQGYYFSRPLPFVDMLDWVQQRREPANDAQSVIRFR